MSDEVLEMLVPPVVVVVTLTVERVEEGDGNDTSGFKGGTNCGPEPVTTPPGRSVVGAAAASSSSSSFFFFIASSLSFTSLRMRRASVSLAFSL